VILSPGLNRITVIAAADQSQVYGMILDPKTSQPLPNARVALQGDRGEYSVQTDQAGRFLFGKIIPGEYRICAWTDIAPERVAEEATWEQAGCQSRIIPIAPASEVEIDLKAAP
jgi:Carboxypeptidase regulatory-like domain